MPPIGFGSSRVGLGMSRVGLATSPIGLATSRVGLAMSCIGVTVAYYLPLQYYFCLSIITYNGFFSYSRSRCTMVQNILIYKNQNSHFLIRLGRSRVGLETSPFGLQTSRIGLALSHIGLATFRVALAMSHIGLAVAYYLPLRYFFCFSIITYPGPLVTVCPGALWFTIS